MPNSKHRISEARLKKAYPVLYTWSSKTFADEWDSRDPQAWSFSVKCFAQAYKTKLRGKCVPRDKVPREREPPPQPSKNESRNGNRSRDGKSIPFSPARGKGKVPDLGIEN